MHSETPKRAIRRKDIKQNGSVPRSLSRSASKSKAISSAEKHSTEQTVQTAAGLSELEESSVAPPPTRIVALVDIGFGNSLFVRGEGDGLSWLKGVPLTCVAAANWVWTTEVSQQQVTFKLLLNDDVWSQGDNWVVQGGQSIAVVPSF
jgi:hypothetical protein